MQHKRYIVMLYNHRAERTSVLSSADIASTSANTT